jgi:hypothetical protein
MFNEAIKEGIEEQASILNRGTVTNEAAMQIESNFLNAK